MQLEINVVDAFTDTVFKGNSAAVIITDNWLSDDLMQSIAFENNLSETGFIVSDDKIFLHIRWFSPFTEIAFCGHGTLASAFVLFNKNPTLTAIKFSAKAVGILTIVKTESGKIQMDFPNTKPEKVYDIPDSLLVGLSIVPIGVYRNEKAYFVVCESEYDVFNVECDNEKLKELLPLNVGGDLSG